MPPTCVLTAVRGMKLHIARLGGMERIVPVSAVVVLGLTALGLAVTGCGDEPSAASPIPPSASARFTVRGTLTLIHDRINGPAHHCHGTGSYEDLTGGAQVLVRDGNGSSLAVARLRPGNLVDGRSTCVFAF